MREKRKRKLKIATDQRGLSLIELIVAISMSVIILGAAFMFITGAQRAYHTAEYGIDLQMEGQILMEQIGNWVMESSRIVVISPDSDDTVLLLYSIPVDSNNGLTMTDYPLDYPGPDTMASCRVIFMGDGPSGGKTGLFMKNIKKGEIDNVEDHIESALNATTGDLFCNRAVTGDAKAENCIGDLVESFMVSVPEGQDKSQLTSINITMTMKKGTTEYTLKNTFDMRNGMYNQFKLNEESPDPEETPDPEDSPDPGA